MALAVVAFVSHVLEERDYPEYHLRLPHYSILTHDLANHVGTSNRDLSFDLGRSISSVVVHQVGDLEVLPLMVVNSLRMSIT